MSIRMIAVDMDGTFLKSDKSYNRARFLKQYQALKQRGIRFVAASGNPLYTLRQYFPEIQNEIAYVAENGAYVVDGQSQLNYSAIAPALLAELIADLKVDYAANLILCGQDCAYIGAEVPASSLPKLNVYLKNLKRVDDLAQLDVPICKITLNNTPENEQAVRALLAQHPAVLAQKLSMVSSGFGFIDLILPGHHKAFGLGFLQQRFAIQADEILAMGDNYNDLQMIQHVGYGFAMANAVDALKQVAKYHCASNDDEAVLDVIDWVLEGKEDWSFR